MVYTLAMQLKESLTELLVSKAALREMEDQAEQLKLQEVRDSIRKHRSRQTDFALHRLNSLHLKARL